MGLGSIATLGAAVLLGSGPQAAQRFATGAIPEAAAQGELEAGLRALNDFNDALAHRILTYLIGEDPPEPIAAKAHIYLGLIEFNRLNTTGAREEFQRAVEIDPAVEPPLTMSPKAAMVFEEARRRVAVDLAKPIARPPAPPPAPVPAADSPGLVPSVDATQPRPAAVTESTPTATVPPAAGATAKPTGAKASPHILTWSLGAGGVVLGAIALVGLAQVLSYNSVAANANTHPGTIHSSEVAPALANAQAWQPWSIGLGIGAAALLVTAVVVW